MRYVFVFIVFAWSFSGIQAQSNWAPIGATWMYRYVVTFTQDTSTCYIKSVGDTIIQGRQCRIFIKNHTGCDERTLTEYMFADSGKIYFFDPQRNIFQLLFNINAGVGEKFSLMPGLPPYNDSLVTMVDSVTTININGYLLRKLVVHTTHHTPYVQGYGGVIIENLGNSFYMFPWYYTSCDEVVAGPLGCYQDSILGFYDFGTISNCSIASVDTLQPGNMISIYPNPNNGKFSVSLYSGISKLEIYDMLGQLIYHVEYIGEKKNAEVDLSQRLPGIFFCKVSSGSQVFTQKIIFA
jgi:hypothetical protein